MVKYEVDDTIIRSAKKCENRHACLNASIPLCSVEHCLMHRIYYVACLSDEPCPYKKALDHSNVCTCPIRKEIFNRYGE